MAYKKQTWTAPEGTGLNRYAKGAETTSHIELNLDPANLTNTPTPITVARLNHMEDGIEEADKPHTIPTDAVLQYSFDEIKQLPDNPTGTVYKRDNDWTTVDEGIVFNGTASFSDGKIIFTSTTPDLYFKRNTSFSGSSFTKIVLKFYGKQSSNTGQIFYSTSSHGVSASYTKVFFIPENGGITFIDMTALSVGGSDWVSSTITAVRIDLGGDTGQVFTVESLYIGDGSYVEPVIDNSYSEAHAENHGVIPVDGVCGKAGYFNNSYMIAPRPALGDDITVYFWAKFDALGTQIIVQSRTVTGSGFSVFQIISSYVLHWRGNQSTFTGYTPPVNTWHHVCMKMNATTVVLKINGEIKVALTGTYGTTTNLASTIWSGMAGTGGTPSGLPLIGALDGLKIVPRFTTDDEDTCEYKARANLPKFNKDIIKVRVSLRHGTTLFEKTWAGLTSFNGNNVWTDGDNIYYSYDATQYVLNKSTSTWNPKTWTGLTSFRSNYIWTDGDNIYYSNSTTQYILNKTTSTWTAKTWAGLTSYSGINIWTDGDNIYYSLDGSHFVLNKSTSTWTTKTWTGLILFTGLSVWTDGDNIYYSNGTQQNVLDKTTSTWTTKTWAGLTSFNGNNVWTDGDNIYYSFGTTQYVLNKSTSTWSVKTWIDATEMVGSAIWTDGENIYNSVTTTQYVLPATRHNYVDDNKYNSLFGTVTKCICSTLSDSFVFSNE